LPANLFVKKMLRRLENEHEFEGNPEEIRYIDLRCWIDPDFN
jgi:hypothetical protein